LLLVSSLYIGVCFLVEPSRVVPLSQVRTKNTIYKNFVTSRIKGKDGWPH
jgi:hypothetical protein